MELYVRDAYNVLDDCDDDLVLIQLWTLDSLEEILSYNCISS